MFVATKVFTIAKRATMKAINSHTTRYGFIWRVFPFVVGLVLMSFCGTASAGRFVNLAETATFPRGEGEVVQVTAFSTCNGTACRVDALEFQVGVEYGLIDHLQVGFALPNVVTSWTQDQRTTEVGGTALWGFFNFVDPADKGWGLSLAAIAAESPVDRRGEMVLLVEKPLGDWIFVYNGSVGRSWARIDEFGSTEGMTHSLGMSFQVTNSIFLGLEGDWHLDHGDGSRWETAGRHLGPNLSVETGPLWITAAAHFAFGPGDFAPGQVFQTQVGLPF